MKAPIKRPRPAGLGDMFWPPAAGRCYVREWLGRWSPTGLWITTRGTAPTPGLEFVGRDFVRCVPFHIPRAKKSILNVFDHHDHHQIVVVKIDADGDAFGTGRANL
jgi:hypothetical protein